MSKLKTRIAAAVTVVGLGGLAGLALGAGEQNPAPSAVAEKPVVRTKVIRRTIHVTKHARPKRPAATGSGGELRAASGPGSAGGAGASATTGSSSSGSYEASSAEASPVTTSTSGSSAAPANYESGGYEGAPVTTSTSGGGSVSAGGGEAGGYGGESEHESEGGDD